MLWSFGMASSGRLLIVEGDRSTRDTLVSQFEQEGVRIENATSADAALARLAEQDFDVVVSDVGLSGLDLVSELARRKRATLVVLLPGEESETAQRLAPEAVIAAVKQALDNLAQSERESEGESAPAEAAGPSGEDFLAAAAARGMTLHELDERYTEHVLRATGGNKVRAARILGIDRKTLYRRAEREARLAASRKGE
jgi:DNA-binding NtrC family response regulator